MGSALQQTRVTFTSRAALDDKIVDRYELKSKVIAVQGTRTISKSNMVRNSALPVIEVNPETYAVTVDGVHATIEPAESLPLTQLYFFS